MIEKQRTVAADPDNNLRGIMIKGSSKSYDAYEQKAVPSAGTSVPAGKDRDEKDTLKAKHTVEAVRDAKDVAGAAKKAIDRQCGHPPALQDNEPHSNSGCGPSATDPGK